MIPDAEKPDHHVLVAASDLYGADSLVFRHAGHSQNAVYGYEKNGQSYIMRITHSSRATLNMLHGELDWIQFLNTNGLQACEPIRSLSGKQVECIEANGETFYVIVFEKARGKPVTANDLTARLFEEQGRLLGKMHALTKSYIPGNDRWRRPEWHESVLLNVDVERYLTSAEQGVRIRLQELVEQVKSFPRERELFGLIHADVCYDNFYLHGEKIVLFDFGNCEYGHFVSDIANSIYSSSLTSLRRQQDKNVFSGPLLQDFVAYYWNHFWIGYESDNKLEKAVLNQITTFLHLYDIVVYVHHMRTLDMRVLPQTVKDDLNRERKQIEDGICPIDFEEVLKDWKKSSTQR